jgi:hypothetical protein
MSMRAAGTDRPSHDVGLTGMPTLTEPVVAMRPIERSCAMS